MREYDLIVVGGGSGNMIFGPEFDGFFQAGFSLLVAPELSESEPHVEMGFKHGRRCFGG